MVSVIQHLFGTPVRYKAAADTAPNMLVFMDLTAQWITRVPHRADTVPGSACPFTGFERGNCLWSSEVIVLSVS